MKYLPLLFLIIFSCQPPNHPSINIYDNLGIFHPIQDYPIIQNAVESSLSTDLNGNQVVYYDLGMVGSFDRLTTQGTQHLSSNKRFSYVFKHGSIWYNIFTVNSDVYLDQSTDGTTFTAINAGNPILIHQVGTIYEQIWNVGADIDDTGTWRILIECAVAGSASPGLATSYATLSGSNINFDANRSPGYVISNGGNPDVKFLSGKGWLITYGALYTVWVVVMATADIDFTSVTPSSKFYITYPNKHIADPSLQSFGGYAYLTASYDQNSIYEWRTGGTLAQIFDTVK